MSFIYVPFSYLMKGCLWLSGNRYAIALLFFALALQVIMIPLYIKQQKSQILAAKVRPMEMAIREKYKGRTDRATMQKMNMEIQEMYQKNGYSQFSGCLPMLITLPLIFILYAIVRQPISYASDLTDKDTGFLNKNYESAVVFYQLEKESLVRDKYESDADYNEAISDLQTLQVYLGGVQKKDGDTEITVSTASGTTVRVYVFDKEKANSTGELYLANLIVDGEQDIKTKVEEGYLPQSVLDAYNSDEFGFAKYADSLPDFHLFGLNILNTANFGSNAWLLLVPILVFLTQFFAIKLNRKLVPAVPGPNGKPVGSGLFMEVGMPLLSAFFAFRWPAAMGVYWIWRTLLDILKTFVFHKVMPIPKVTQEQIDAAKKELRGSQSQKKKKRITIEVDEDDDSYDELVVNSRESVGEGANRRPRRVEMLSLDEDDENAIPEKKSSEAGEEPGDGNEQK